MKTRALLIAIAAGLCLSFGAHAATSQWKPEQAIELVVGTAPGSGPDRNARVMQKIFQDGKFFSVPLVVANKPGAGSTVSGAYVHKFEGNGHYVLMSGKALISSDVMGRLSFPYTELTPITHTMDEYIGVAVKADSPIRSGRDLLERLQKDPSAHSIAIATSLGNANHQAVAAALKASGIDPRKARNVVFNSGGAAITALLGGHVDMVPVSMGLLVGELQSGRIRIIAVTAPQRMPGVFAQVPTWREQGADAVEVQAYFRAMGSPGASTYSGQAPHPYMQKTSALDFAIVLEGEIVLVLDTQEVTMKAGEIAIIRGSNHAWSNRSNHPASVAISSHAGEP